MTNEIVKFCNVKKETLIFSVFFKHRNIKEAFQY